MVRLGSELYLELLRPALPRFALHFIFSHGSSPDLHSQPRNGAGRAHDRRLRAGETVLDMSRSVYLISTAGEFTLDFDLLSTRLQIEEARLSQWAEGVGLVAYDLRSRHVSLSSDTTQPQIERVFKAIERLLT